MIKSLVYDVKFPDGDVKQYAAKAEQADSEGYHYNILGSIIKFGTNDQSPKKYDKYITTKIRNRWIRKTIIGWKLLIKWKDMT